MKELEQEQEKVHVVYWFRNGILHFQTSDHWSGTQTCIPEMIEKEMARVLAGRGLLEGSYTKERIA